MYVILVFVNNNKWTVKLQMFKVHTEILWNRLGAVVQQVFLGAYDRELTADAARIAGLTTTNIDLEKGSKSQANEWVKYSVGSRKVDTLAVVVDNSVVDAF